MRRKEKHKKSLDSNLSEQANRGTPETLIFRKVSKVTSITLTHTEETVVQQEAPFPWGSKRNFTILFEVLTLVPDRNTARAEVTTEFAQLIRDGGHNSHHFPVGPTQVWVKEPS